MVQRQSRQDRGFIPISGCLTLFLSLLSSLSFSDASSHLYKSVCPSVHPSVHPSVTHFFFNARKRVFLIVKTARGWGWRGEVIGSDEGGREGSDKGGDDKGLGE